MRSAVAIAVAAALAVPASAAAAPVNVERPTIAGKPNYGEQLTCNPGVWLGATSFDYAWRRDGATIATGRHWRATAGAIGDRVRCRVAAHGVAASAHATSDPTAPIGVGIARLSITSVQTGGGLLVVLGTARPAGALRSAGRKAHVALYRRADLGRLLELDGAAVKADGGFVLVTHDSGRHRYRLALAPAFGTHYGGAIVERTITVAR